LTRNDIFYYHCGKRSGEGLLQLKCTLNKRTTEMTSKLISLIFIIFSVLLAAPAVSTEAASMLPTAEAPFRATHADPAAEKEAEAHDHAHGHGLDGGMLPLWSCLPFVFMLLSIAFWPLLAPGVWHHHFGKISFFWALALAGPLVYAYKAAAVYEILHILLADYVPFIILLWSLYTVSGGIILRGSISGTPLINTFMLLVGTLLASWMGTTGASMLMIRPLLRANKNRRNRTFMVVFFIFLVGNIGGALTPLGDPPLFLGFLRGVDFFWTFNLLPHMLVMTVLLLSVYYLLDVYFFRKEQRLEPAAARQARSTAEPPERVPLGIDGKRNFLFLAGIVAMVLFSGMADMGTIDTLGVNREVQGWIRDIMLVVCGLLSLVFTPPSIRQDNDFTWFPIKEVAYLFVGIFITMIPCLLILKAGSAGALAFIINQVETPVHYFWVTGLLSGFLDNAPTYLTFFSTALGSFYSGMSEAQAVPLLMTEKALYLIAISSGAVFFGAFSYIGNAPNFMVRSIAEEAGTPMPSFFGYVIRYTLVFLVPSLVLVTWIFF
jgi:Na+/H+ antiporter NhaD/arsenite permease-like protein